MGAVAACVSLVESAGLSDEDTELTTRGQASAFPDIEGLAFCFLPLPVKTSLPVHVNAYFELSSNRRDIWRGDDTTGESKVRGQWNVRLMEDVLAPLYALLLKKLSKQLGHEQRGRIEVADYRSTRAKHSSILSLLPCPDPPVPWNIVSSAVLPLIKDAPVSAVVLHTIGI